MRRIKPFTREEVLELFYVDPTSASGLRWVVNYRDKKHGDEVGYLAPSANKRYGSIWHVCFNGRPHLVARIVWTIVNGTIPAGLVIDHINGNPRDNRIENLQAVTHAVNTRARTKKSIRNSSGFTGVGWSNQRNMWRARIFRNWKEIHIGFFHSKEDAAKARDSAELKWAEENGESVRLLNFPN